MSQNETMTLALQITAVGMGLVFAAIILLWGMMALLMRVAGQDAPAEAEEESGPAEAVDAALVANADTQAARKRLAAAAAVAVAMARQCESSEPHEFPLPPTAIVSAWQAIMRTRMLSKRGPTR